MKWTCPYAACDGTGHVEALDFREARNVRMVRCRCYDEMVVRRQMHARPEERKERNDFLRMAGLPALPPACEGCPDCTTASA